MNSCNLYRSISQFLLHLSHLITIGSNDTDFILWVIQFRQNLLTDHINLPLVHMVTLMVSWHSGYKLQCTLSVAIRHDDQVTVIKLLVTKADNLRMATIMLA